MCVCVCVGGGGFLHLPVPSSSCGFVLVSISLCFSLLSVLFGCSAHVCQNLWQGDYTHNCK